jgi:hypothetical protein
MFSVLLCFVLFSRLAISLLICKLFLVEKVWLLITIPLVLILHGLGGMILIIALFRMYMLQKIDYNQFRFEIKEKDMREDEFLIPSL